MKWLSGEAALESVSRVCRYLTRKGLTSVAFLYEGRVHFAVETPYSARTGSYAVRVTLDPVTTEAEITGAFQAALDMIRREGLCTGS